MNPFTVDVSSITSIAYCFLYRLPGYSDHQVLMIIYETSEFNELLRGQIDDVAMPTVDLIIRCLPRYYFCFENIGYSIGWD